MVLKRTLGIILLSLFFVACGKKNSASPSQPPEVSHVVPSPAAPPAPAEVQPPPTPANTFDGEWNGSSGENLPLSFTVQKNQVSPVNVNLKGKKDSCNFFSSFPSESSSSINGKSFSTHGKKDQFEFTLNGTFLSPNEASGTIDWKGKLDMCGGIEMQFKWTAKKGAAGPSEEE